MSRDDGRFAKKGGGGACKRMGRERAKVRDWWRSSCCMPYLWVRTPHGDPLPSVVGKEVP
eukprot:7993172-Pyramimonas_sp.AAC.1